MVYKGKDATSQYSRSQDPSVAIDRTGSQRGRLIIAKAGKPLVKVLPLDGNDRVGSQRLGFMAGEIAVPDAFDRMGEDEIQRRFGVGA